ncbi:MAG: DUF4383 domain-containing protein [Ferruginibacter sp.]
MHTNLLSNTWSVLTGLFLFTAGLWFFFSESVFEILTTNTLHAFLYISIGIAGLYFWSKSDTRSFNIVVGIFLLTIGILRFIPGTNQVIENVLNENYAVAYLNIGAGGIGLIIGLLSPRQKQKHNVALIF